MEEELQHLVRQLRAIKLEEVEYVKVPTKLFFMAIGAIIGLGARRKEEKD